MNISGIGSYADNYNSIKINSLLRQQELRPAADEQVRDSGADDGALRQREQQEIRKKQNFQSGDYAKQYEPGKSYELKGADSDLTSLDESKDTPDSKKSRIMKQYQLFMGEAQARNASQAAMNARTPRRVEDFSF